ncbi:MAG: aminoacyl-tRNA hydrolase [Bdellovibrionota bacterium]
MKVPRNEIYFTFARSSGPGGQNVNKVNSKAILHWNVRHSALPYPVIARFFVKYSNRISEDGELVLQSVLTAINPAIKKTASFSKRNDQSVKQPPRKRRKTKPTRASKEKRLTSKKQQGRRKKTTAWF